MQVIGRRQEAARALQAAPGRTALTWRVAGEPQPRGEADRHGQRVRQEAGAEEEQAVADDSQRDKPNLASEIGPASRTKIAGDEKKIGDPKLEVRADACPLEAGTKARGCPGRCNCIKCLPQTFASWRDIILDEDGVVRVLAGHR